MLDQPVRTRSERGGHQVIDVSVHRGYRPSTIRAVAGVPLRIVFRREDDDTCSERVVFSNPRMDHRLSATGATTIDLPAQPPGEIRFTCGMGRYRGRIQIVDDSRSTIVQRVREQAGRRSASLGRAAVVGMGSTAVTLLVMALVGDAHVAIAAVGVSLLAVVALRLRAHRKSERPI
jgi:Cupredoxin-like domain